MNIRHSETSPQAFARIAAMLYLVTIIAGIISQMVIAGKIIVDGIGKGKTDHRPDL